jgi:hypothetical protein
MTFVAGVSALTLAGYAADPLAELSAISSFKDVNLEKLAGGTVQITRGPAMSFPRGLAVESVYVIRKPVAATAQFHVQWNANKHPELKVYLHGDVSSRPAPGDFQKLGSTPANASVKAFVAATQKLGSGGTELQLSKAEAASFASRAASGSDGGSLPAKVTAFWSDVLFRRAQAFLAGGATRLPPYETQGESVKPADEVAQLLKGAPKVRQRYAALIDANPLTGTKNVPPQAADWEMFDVEGQAAVNLGALYSLTQGDTWQGLEGVYYSSGGYYALLIFYQMWPVKVGGRDCTLVWRTDLISAATLATLHGVERMGSSTAMMRETKKLIESMVKDAAQTP